jgi:2-polyprenyl-3-methyl-5-hydroxy-6-metoxy-1,4-benzoquinol methylase
VSRAFYEGLAREAAARYPASDRFARGFAYGKLTRDPAFRYLLERGLVRPGARVLDLGCGQGLLATLLAAAGDAGANGWPRDWGEAPAGATVHAIEIRKSDVERARAAGCAAEIVHADIRSAAFAAADVCVLLDVLHYLDRAAQDDVLRRAKEALAEGGLLLVRVADRSQGARYALTVAADRLATAMRGNVLLRYHHRTLAEWDAALAALGFDVEHVSMSAGTPFANVLLVARYDRPRCTRSASPPTR